MALKIEKPNSSSKDGIFIDRAVIEEVKDVSRTPIFSGKFTPDLGVVLTLDVGRDFKPELTIAGNLNGEEWGSAFKLRELFLACGLSGELDEVEGKYVIPKEILDGLVGKTIKKLSYRSGTKPNGNARYNDWDLVFPAGVEDDKIRSLFLDQVTKSTYLSKKYKPNGDDEEGDITPLSEPSVIKDDMPF